MARRMKPGMVRVYLRDRVIRVVPNKEALRLLDSGKASMRYAEAALGIDLQASRAQAATARTKVSGQVKSATYSVLNDPDARRSCVVLSKNEAAAVAERRPSRTERMSFTDPRRDMRIAAGLAEMDEAERARVKFNAMFGAGAATLPGAVLQSCAA